MRMNAFTLNGKRALVTGGTRGIGAAVAMLLGGAGADVCVGYRSRRGDAEKVVAGLAALGVKGEALAANLATASGAESLVGHAVKELGGLDILVHSAGIWPADDVPATEMTEERWSATLRENLDATFFVTRAAAKAMSAQGARRNGGGRIVLVSSTAGQRGEAGHSDYAASKGAMISFVKSVAVELARHDITVNAVAPGWVDTEMCEAPFAGGGKERIAAGIPVGRVATPEDIAFPVVSLCFDGARHVTGEILNVNGGAVLCG